MAVWLPWDPRWPYGCHGILGGRLRCGAGMYMMQMLLYQDCDYMHISCGNG